jgi:hypothetical protein
MLCIPYLVILIELLLTHSHTASRRYVDISNRCIVGYITTSLTGHSSSTGITTNANPSAYWIDISHPGSSLPTTITTHGSSAGSGISRRITTIFSTLIHAHIRTVTHSSKLPLFWIDNKSNENLSFSKTPSPSMTMSDQFS